MKSNLDSYINFDSYIKEKIREKAQVSIFIIFAILIIAGIVLFFILKGNLFQTSVPREFEPAYNYYLSCVQSEAENAVSVLGSQGGYIELPDFERGSEYMPFSNQLDFLGNAVPYWYYISGNGIVKEQIPSKEKMQEEINSYLKDAINECNFKSFAEQGIDVNFGEGKITSSIKDSSVSVSIKQELTITNDESSWTKDFHTISFGSSLGKSYDLANTIYSNNKQRMFLENYGVDILRLYAPVDGSEIGCSPKIWMVNNVRDNLTNALENNIPAIKIKGNYYVKSNKYFVQDIGENSDASVNFMYSADWPMKMEVWPSENNMLIAEPVGLQEGLGMLGFCYTSYHYVYDFAFPVMIQIYSGNELFQFPVVVYIEKNNPREALNVEGLPDVVPELCDKKNTELSVSTYNTNLEPVEAEIRFKCFDTSCEIGKTKIENKDAILTDNFPQCKNGYILASAEGYETGRHLIDSIQEGEAIIILNKKYKLDLEIKKQGSLINDYAIITFTRDNKVTTVSYPEQKQVELIEGDYEVKTYIYSNSSINLPASSQQKCVDVPKSGIGGIFGATEEKCFNFEIPSQVISNAVSGGGTQQFYMTETELMNKKLVIDAESFGVPQKIEDIQLNYNKIDTGDLNIYFE